MEAAFEGDPRVQILSHSVAPEHDTGEVLREHAYFSKARSASGKTTHTENVLLVDGRRRIRGLYNGTLELGIQRLIDDVRRLEAE